ncbi:MAG: hypothetical protein LQ342_007526 [Letrouitia transgressa]|nr:MAG: hypothetical protein LQ342_007526 [Letrouitia transgressa]
MQKWCFHLAIGKGRPSNLCLASSSLRHFHISASRANDETEQRRQIPFLDHEYSGISWTQELTLYSVASQPRPSRRERNQAFNALLEDHFRHGSNSAGKPSHISKEAQSQKEEGKITLSDNITTDNRPFGVQQPTSGSQVNDDSQRSENQESRDSKSYATRRVASDNVLQNGSKIRKIISPQNLQATTPSKQPIRGQQYEVETATAQPIRLPKNQGSTTSSQPDRPRKAQNGMNSNQHLFSRRNSSRPGAIATIKPKPTRSPREQKSRPKTTTDELSTSNGNEDEKLTAAEKEYLETQPPGSASRLTLSSPTNVQNQPVKPIESIPYTPAEVSVSTLEGLGPSTACTEKGMSETILEHFRRIETSLGAYEEYIRYLASQYNQGHRMRFLSKRERLDTIAFIKKSQAGVDEKLQMDEEEERKETALTEARMKEEGSKLADRILEGKYMVGPFGKGATAELLERYTRKNGSYLPGDSEKMVRAVDRILQLGVEPAKDVETT